MRGEHLHTELMSKSNSKIIISRGIYWLILLVLEYDHQKISDLDLKSTAVVYVDEAIFEFED